MGHDQLCKEDSVYVLTEVEKRKTLAGDVMLLVGKTELLHSFPEWLAAANRNGFK